MEGCVDDCFDDHRLVTSHTHTPPSKETSGQKEWRGSALEDSRRLSSWRQCREVILGGVGVKGSRGRGVEGVG